ncbi:MAG TPA: peptidylprolyl isomerase [Candidatus Sumerlaeota bacterium]|nr:peptidylprolyl isomerase [Candidatus Sumerlaeota bacterium]
MSEHSPALALALILLPAILSGQTATPAPAPAPRPGVVIIDDAPESAPVSPGEEIQDRVPRPDPKTVFLCVVDHRRLTQADVNNILDRLMAGKRGTPEQIEQQRLVYTQNIMTEWIERNVLAAEAENEAITVTDAEIDEQEGALKDAADVDFDINKALEKIGFTREEYRRQLRDAILGEKLVKKRIPSFYSEADLRKIYDSNPKAYQLPPRVRASHIFCPIFGDETPDKKTAKKKFMDDARKKAAKTPDLKTIARDADPLLSIVGGDLGWLTATNRLPRPVNELVFKLKPGKISDVIETDYGLYLIRIEEKQPLKGRTYEEAREAVMDDVFEEVRRKVLDAAMKTHRILINISGIPPHRLP